MMITAKDARFLAKHGELNPHLYDELDEYIRSAAVSGYASTRWFGVMPPEMQACLEGEGFRVMQHGDGETWTIDWSPLELAATL
jgi:hypothetical protein